MVEQAQHADAQRSCITTVGLLKNVADSPVNPVCITVKMFEIAGNNIVVAAKLIYMDREHEFDLFEITEDTDVEIKPGYLTTEEHEWLRRSNALSINGFHTETGEVTRIKLDVEEIARIAFEFDLLKQVASTVEIEILETFRNSEDSTLTTSEIAQATGRPKSSVSRALSRLVEKTKLDKVQAGVYRTRS
ncbi:helix-turn-helix domain-containing protein [Salinigranum halophilum]|jgi:Fic family protein|uniref:helix-turn-helix domain-containing protein n=1 Tax=Salinigranum halophilum TaxID=2565931 RepID=UPI0010A7EA7C|nr:helix-turn-helix domain-containing protein [Salinigranum halophilum]